MTTQGGAVHELPIIQYWHSEDLSPEIAHLTATFRDCNPAVRHVVFCESEAEEFIAEHLTEPEVAAFRSCAVLAMEADYFRYYAVLMLGGVYSDADFRCLCPLQALIETTEGGLLFRQAPSGYLINAFFLFKAPGHPLLRLALDVATANIERCAAPRVNLVTSPWVFSGLSALHRLGPFDAFRQAALDLELMPLAGFFIHAIGDLARVNEACESVHVGFR
jgi:mannosyltransferase OCH1-like enzyme